MRSFAIPSRYKTVFRLSALAGVLAAVVSAPARAADHLAGIVLDQTTGRPAAGDDVILLRLGNGMEEQARVKSDAHGAFSFAGMSADAQYVIRVVHQGVIYNQTLIDAASVEIHVFDVVPKIKGLRAGIGMAQMESEGKTLKVTEMYAITNASNPPVTQAGPRNFEIQLPAEAALDGAEAKRGEGIWTKTRPLPAPGQRGRYAIDFPIRPGDTLFKYAYHLPYSSPARFHLTLPYPVLKFAVMHPPSMSFRSLQKDAFTSPGTAHGLQIEKAVREPLAGMVPPFEISGVGTTAPSAATGPAQVLPAPVATGLSSAAARQAMPVARSSEAFWILFAAIWLVLAVAGFAVAKARHFWTRRDDPRESKPLLVEVLKEEMFQLEVERAQGSISSEDYAATKQALRYSLQRALAKAGAGS